MIIKLQLHGFDLTLFVPRLNLFVPRLNSVTFCGCDLVFFDSISATRRAFALRFDIMPAFNLPLVHIVALNQFWRLIHSGRSICKQKNGSVCSLRQKEA